MNDPIQTPKNNWPFVTATLAGLSIMIGLMGLSGWIFDSNFLRSFLSDGATMKVNTALLLITGGLGLWLINKNHFRSAAVCCWFVVLLSLAILGEHLLGLNLHIDELLIQDTVTDIRREFPGRTSVLTAINALIVGAGFLLLLTQRYRAAQLLASTAFILVYVSLIGHVFQISGFYYLGRYSGIAFHTALGLLIMSIGILTATSAHGWIAFVYHRMIKGNLLIYFLSYFLGAAPLFAAIYLFIIQKATLSPASDVIILIAFTVLLSLPVAYFLLKLVNRMGRKLSESDNKLEIALEAAKFGSYDLDLGTMQMSCTAQCKANYGLPEDAAFNFAELLAAIIPEYRESMQEKVNTAIEQHATYHDEYPVRWPDDTVHWITAIGKASYDEQGKALTITGVTFDNTMQRNAQRELERSLEQARLSKEAAQLGIFDMDLEAGTLDWDERCRHLFGISHKDSVTYEKDFVTGLHPEDRDRVTKLIDNLFTKKISNGEYDVEYRTIGVENGITRWVRAKGQVLFDIQDKPVRFIGSVLDVTASKTYEEELQAVNEEMAAVNEEMAAANEELTSTNEELIETQNHLQELLEKLSASDNHFRHLVKDAPVAINVLRGEAMVTESINDMMLRIIGKKPEDMIGRPYREAIPELIGQPFLDLLDQVYHSGEIYYGNEAQAYLLQDGKPYIGYFNFIYQPIKNMDGTTNGIMIVATEVTDLFAARKEREEAELKLGLAVEGARIGSWHIDPESKALKYNTMLAQLFGYEGPEAMTYEQAIGQVTEEYRPKILAAIATAIDKGGDYDIIYQQKRFNDGETIWLHSLGKISQDKDGAYSVFSGVVMDVTEEKHDELRKNDFIGMVSHELKTPLTSLSALVQMLNVKLKDNPDLFVPGALEKANTQVKKMSAMINGFLNISRLESGKIQINKEVFDLEKLIEEMIRETELTVSSHDIYFSPCQPLPIKADRDKIGSVISNLISNAVKYSPKQKLVEIKCEIIGHNAVVSIRDEGIGIKIEDKDKLFDRYYRVDNNTAHVSGFGIGLYLSAEIVQRHDGKIWVESEPGKGSTFFFSLPVNKV